MNQWQRIVAYFNTRYAHHQKVVKRVELLKEFYFVDIRTELLDSYRLYLTRAGYLSHIGNGKYRVEKPIPVFLSQRECYRRAYPKDRLPRCSV